ncbi:hypothetical protein OU415_16530 [Saccharopolyspora sp. WRP15-2]|uniref:Uncharacterized protein n=1 Tax=Saccharopolyspora oryzae TaxID=2997343 RepID=A0ABT4UZB2_9PSEU|nr:hypothetical protein [Saccharopolyspora oryzae]MDA3627052.1 hypothetical protein [Saccharopolyspora oryzae]
MRESGPPVAGAATASAVGFFVAVAGMVPAGAASWWSGEPVAALAVLGIVVLGYACAIRNLPGSLMTALLCWMFLNSFVIHAHGDLIWEGSADLARLAALVGAALIGTACGCAAVRSHEQPEPQIPATRRAPETEHIRTLEPLNHG